MTVYICRWYYCCTYKLCCDQIRFPGLFLILHAAKLTLEKMLRHANFLPQILCAWFVWTVTRWNKLLFFLSVFKHEICKWVYCAQKWTNRILLFSIGVRRYSGTPDERPPSQKTTLTKDCPCVKTTFFFSSLPFIVQSKWISQSNQKPLLCSDCFFCTSLPFIVQ